MVDYIRDPAPESALNLGGSIVFIKAAFEAFKAMVKEAMQGRPVEALGAPAPSTGAGAAPGKDGSTEVASLKEQLKQLKVQLQQRDREIEIMVGMLSKREQQQQQAGAAAAAAAAAAPAPRPAAALLAGAAAQPRPPSATSSGGTASSPSTSGPDDLAALADPSILADRTRAFELFRKSYRKTEVIEENKALLKTRYEEAKGMGAEVNDAKQRIQELRALLEQRRVQRSVAALSGGSGEDEAGPDAEEERLKQQVEREKGRYKSAFESLKALKQEIENIQMLLEKSRKQLQKDFEQWLVMMTRQLQQQVAWAGQPMPLQPKEAWVNGAAAGPSGNGAGGASAAAPSALAKLDVGRAALGGVARATGPRSPARSVSSSVDLSSIPPEVLQAAGPMLTGNPEADRDILRFYKARHDLMRAQGGKVPG